MAGPYGDPYKQDPTLGQSLEEFEAQPLVDNALYDVGKSVVYGGAKAVGSVWNLLSKMTGGSLFGEVNVEQFISRPTTIVGGLVGGIVQFALPYTQITKGLSALSAAGKYSKLPRLQKSIDFLSKAKPTPAFVSAQKARAKGDAIGMTVRSKVAFQSMARQGAVGGLADFIAFEGNESRFSDIIEQYPDLQNPMSEWLASDGEDSELEGRMKNVLEGAALGGLVDGLTNLLKGRRVYNRLIAQGVAEEDAISASVAAVDESAAARRELGRVAEDGRLNSILDEEVTYIDKETKETITETNRDVDARAKKAVADAAEISEAKLDEIGERFEEIEGDVDQINVPRDETAAKREALQQKEKDVNLTKIFRSPEGAAYMVRAIEQSDIRWLPESWTQEQRVEHALKAAGDALNLGQRELTEMAANLPNDAETIRTITDRMVAYQFVANQLVREITPQIKMMRTGEFSPENVNELKTLMSNWVQFQTYSTSTASAGGSLLRARGMELPDEVLARDQAGACGR